METQARSVGVVSRLAAFVILYAFLVKTVLLLAAPLAPTAGHGSVAGGAPFSGFALCTGSAADAVAGKGDSPGPEHRHDTSCCLLHCQAQLVALAVLVPVAVAVQRPSMGPVWRADRIMGDGREAAGYRFYARGPPLAGFARAG